MSWRWTCQTSPSPPSGRTRPGWSSFSPFFCTTPWNTRRRAQPSSWGPNAGARGVLFSVRDHGPGVPEKDRQRIFRRFARGEECRTGKEHFGLGLSIARQIAALHGGRLWVEDAPGGGAAFCLELPAGR